MQFGSFGKQGLKGIGIIGHTVTHCAKVVCRQALVTPCGAAIAIQQVVDEASHVTDIGIAINVHVRQYDASLGRSRWHYCHHHANQHS